MLRKFIFCYMITIRYEANQLLTAVRYNSPKKNFNLAKLKRHLAYIENQLKEYEAKLDANDKEEDRKELETKIEERKEKQAKYKQIKEDLDNSTAAQVSLKQRLSRTSIFGKHCKHRKIFRFIRSY